MRGILEFYIDLSCKLRKNREDEIVRNKQLIDQNNDFLNAMTAVKQMKSTENLDYYLFGIKRLTEQKYFGIMHAAKQSLKIANHELAYRQVKFIDDFYEFLLSQQKKIEHGAKKVESMEIEIVNLRRTLKENKVKSFEDQKNMLKFSDHIKSKIESMNVNQTDHLEEVFNNRYKEAVKQKEEAEKEKNKMVHKLVKIKAKMKAFKDEFEALKVFHFQKSNELKEDFKYVTKHITNTKRDSKKIYHSRPKAPIIDLNKIFEDYIKMLQFKIEPSSIGLKGVAQSKRWTQAIINLIYLEKTKKDIEDYKDGRPLITLREYIIEWFMITFGNRRVVDPILQDFIMSCIEYENTHERFKTFLNLAGIHVSDGRIIKYGDNK